MKSRQPRSSSLPFLARNPSTLVLKQRKPVGPWIPQTSNPSGSIWLKSTSLLTASDSSNKQQNKNRRQSKASFFLQRIQEHAPVEMKLGTLLTFLDDQNFKAEQRDQRRGKNLSATVPKLFITMNEALSNKTQDELQTLKPDNEHQHETEDPRNVLLHDMHPINRKRAAKKLCQQIESEVRKVSQYYTPSEETPQITGDEDRLELQDADEEVSVDFPNMKLPQLRNVVSGCPSLREKLNKIDELSKKFLAQKTNAGNKKRSVLFQETGDHVQDQEQISSVESNMMKSSKSSEKLKRQDSQYNLDPADFLPENSLSPMIRATETSGFMEKLKKTLPDVGRLEHFVEEIRRTDVVNYLRTCLDPLTRSTTGVKQGKKAVILNTYRVSLPECRLEALHVYYVFRSFPAFTTLMTLDLSENQLGDAIGAFLCYVLAQYAENLSHFNLSYTSCGHKTSKAMQELLKVQHSKLNTVKLAGNKLEDDGICSIVIGILQSEESSVMSLDLSNTSIEMTGVLALAKLLRINRKLHNLDLSESKFDPHSFRELCRAMIVNDAVRSLSIKKCGLMDKDMRDLNQMLRNNTALMELHLNENFLTARALKTILPGLMQDNELLHLGLSGNQTIVLEHLDNVKQELLDAKEVEILKEDDFLKSAEAKRVLEAILTSK